MDAFWKMINDGNEWILVIGLLLSTAVLFGLILAIAGKLTKLPDAIKNVFKGKKTEIGPIKVDDTANKEPTIEELIESRINHHMQLLGFYDDQRDEINKRLWTTEKLELTERYMTMCEERLDLAVKYMGEVHFNLMESKLKGTDVQAHPEVRAYKFKLHTVFTQLKEEFRYALRKDEFLKMDASALYSYSTRKLEYMYKIVEQLNEGNFHSEVILQSELREAQRMHKHEYGKMLLEIFAEAIKISKDIQHELEVLKRAKQLMQAQFFKNHIVILVEDAMQKCYSGECS
jgi:hypothetical protein